MPFETKTMLDSLALMIQYSDVLLVVFTCAVLCELSQMEKTKLLTLTVVCVNALENDITRVVLR